MDWIDVKLSVPKYTSRHGSESVLVWVATEDGISYIQIAARNHAGVWVNADYETLVEYGPGITVCYWMPLPAPPKGDEG